MSIRFPKDKSARGDAFDGVPPARRQPAEISLEEIDSLHRKAQPQPQRGKKLLGTLLVLGGLGGLGYWQWDTVSPHANGIRNGMKAAIAATGFGRLSEEPAPATDATAPDSPNIVISPLPDEADKTTVASTPSVTSGPAETDSDAVETETEAEREAENETLLNHRRYEVVPPEGLVQLNPSSIIKLQPEAQEAIARMITKAKIEGVRLGIISGYRTLEDQNYLYFDLKAERGQSAQTRAEVSAPPGYSEHHTGYAVDFIDESKPETHLSPSFETTEAFKWLEKNAPYFSFEMSFPKDNEANVGYEPWHWRYVGNQESLELFYK